MTVKAKVIPELLFLWLDRVSTLPHYFLCCHHLHNAYCDSYIIFRDTQTYIHCFLGNTLLLICTYCLCPWQGPRLILFMTSDQTLIHILPHAVNLEMSILRSRSQEHTIEILYTGVVNKSILRSLSADTHKINICTISYMIPVGW